jgi:hypothetical protein
MTTIQVLFDGAVYKMRYYRAAVPVRMEMTPAGRPVALIVVYQPQGAAEERFDFVKQAHRPFGAMLIRRRTVIVFFFLLDTRISSVLDV